MLNPARRWLCVLVTCAAASAQDAGPAPEPALPVPRVPIEEQVKPAIESGLVWLCRHQDADGAWHAQSLATLCDADKPCVTDELTDFNDTGLTGLAVLALLGAGASPRTPYVIPGAKAGVTYDTWASVQRAIAWLITQQDEAGSLSGQQSTYSDSIGAMALCETYRLGRDLACRKAAQQAIEYIAESQAETPTGKSQWGWRYVPNDYQSDTSVTAWAVRAFEVGERAGFRAPKSALAGAKAFIEWVTGPSGGLVGYLHPEQAGLRVTGHNDQYDYHVGTMTALGIQIRLRTDSTPSKEAVAWMKTAVRQVLLKDLPTAAKPLAVDYYYWHQGAEAWWLLQEHELQELADAGSVWRRALVEALLTLQTSRDEACKSGGWLAFDRWAYAGGPIYTTAINVLSLESVEPFLKQ